MSDRAPEVNLVTPNADQARILGNILSILDLGGAVTIETGWGWDRREVSSAAVEVMFPPFGMTVKDDDTIPLISPLQSSVMQLADGLHSVQSEEKYNRVRERVHRDSKL